MAGRRQRSGEGSSIIIKQFARVVTGLVAALSLVLGVVAFAPTADAASDTVSIAAPGVGQAIDRWSKGSITTPKVAATGKAKITSRAFVITVGAKTVAKTATAGLKIALGMGTYQVKSTVGYTVGKTKKSATKTVTVKIVSSGRMSPAEYKLIKTGQTPAQVAAIVGSAGTVVDAGTYDCEDEADDETCEPFAYQIRMWQTASANGYAIIVFADGRVDTSLGKVYVA